MIRINLLSAGRIAAKKRKPVQASQKLTMACSAILVVTVALAGWRFWTLRGESAQLDAQISAAQQETTRLHSVIQQVQQFEQRKAQLQQRVGLIEQLRKGQTGPVHMLDQISRALPAMLWLTEVKQNPKVDDEVLIDGRSTTLTGLSDFVVNLEASGYFKKSIEIVSTTTEAIPQPPGELIHFEIRALFQRPEAPKAKAAAGAAPKAGG
jgi:type IV pilus assembly protein PilN